ncbi:50S ribosomal protein L32e [Candidatus Woesearchaeota archaeon]|nr:50S ribosomal protein L32e [Candidatus Woesearchaeota archaeon]
MSNLKALLEYRKHLKGRKPEFIRQDAHKHPSLGRKWRRPRGIQSKMRKNKRGYRASVTIGYRSPKTVRGLHPSGLQSVVVHTLDGLKALDTKTQGATIAHVGMKQKMELLRFAVEKKIPVLNVKDVALFLKKAEEARQLKKEEQEGKRNAKLQKQEELKKVAKTKEAEKKEEAAPPSEEKKKEEVKEVEKILTKKE